MNFVNKSNCAHKCFVVLCITVFVWLSGCSDLKLTPIDQLEEFQNAGPVQPEVDLDKLSAARTTGVYHVVAGDILELRMSEVLHVQTADLPESLEKPTPLLCRVYDDGTIIVPVIGPIQAARLTLADIETSVIEAYYPKYSASRPAVIIRVAEYKTIRASITGAVKEPGVYELASDQISLVSLIMEAGGIVDSGAAFIYIKQSDGKLSPQYVGNDIQNSDTSAQVPDARGVTLSLRQDPLTEVHTLLVRKEGALIWSEVVDVTRESQRRAFLNNISTKHPDIAVDYLKYKLCELAEVLRPGSGSHASTANGNSTLTLPVKGLNIPFADVALRDGVSVEVEPLDSQVFTVVGLVYRPGVFPYPPGVRYNLMQALAFAGGVNEIADPRFIRVYRQRPNGQLVDATFKMDGTSPVGAPSVTIKPGDVVAVEQTSHTRRNLLLAEIFSLKAGAFYIID